jgi:peptide deformylase
MLRPDDLYINLRPTITSTEVVDSIDEVRKFIPAMIAWCRRFDGDWVLTGPQIGVNKRFMITKINGDYPKIFINPIVIGYGELVNEERHEHASVHALNLKNEQFLLSTTTGYYAGREEVGKRMAEAVQTGYKLISG